MKIGISYNLWNRITQSRIAGFLVAIIGVSLVTIDWKVGNLDRPLLGIAIILLICGLFILWLGVYKARHFYREDGQKIFESVSKLAAELKTVGAALHKENEGLRDGNWRFIQDRRYKAISKKFDLERRKCHDVGLDMKLRDPIEHEKLMAQFNNYFLAGHSEIKKTEIKGYINTRLRIRPNRELGVSL